MKYIVADPTENITVLVEEPVAIADRAAVTRRMFEEVPACEQVGYITTPLSDEADIRLEMMGGEFCGNASLSAAAYHVMKNGLLADDSSAAIRSGDNHTSEKSPLQSSSSARVLMECSGVDEPFECIIMRNVSADTDNSYIGTLAMPDPVRTEYIDGHPVIFLPGIAHMILPSDRFTRRQIENNIRDYASGFDVDAFGVLRWDEKRQFMEPCVYVKGFETLIWEHGCATGSTCLGYYRYKSGGHSMTEVHQPGGMIKIDIRDEKIYLTGSVVFK